MDSVNRFVGNVSIKLKIDSVTSTTEDAPQMYLLDEVVSMAGSRGDTVRAAVEAIMKRLQHRSPIVKQKALRLVKHAGSRGSGELRTALAQQSAVLRELTQYRCEPDPFTGDVVWKRVQELAKDALAAVHGTGMEPQAGGLFGSQQPSSLQPAVMPWLPPPGPQGRIQGFGSDAGGARGSRGGGMVGFGSESAGMAGFGRDSYAASTSTAAYASPNTSSYVPASSSYSAPAAPRSAGGPIVHLSGSAPAPAAGSAGTGRAADAHTAERRLVDRLCTPAGLRAAPEHADLRAFVEGLAPLSGAAAAVVLQDKLDKGPWQATLRALHALQAAAQDGSSAACNELVEHFRSSPEPLTRAASSAQASVRQQAQRVLAALGLTPDAATVNGGGAGGGSPAGWATPASTVPPAAAVDLLGGLAEEELGPDGVALGADPADLLAGLQLDAPAGAGAAPMSAGAAAMPAAPSSPIDLLNGLDFGAATPAAAGSRAAAPLAADLFGMPSTSSPQPLAAAADPFAPPVLAAPASRAQPAAAAPDLLGDSLGALMQSSTTSQSSAAAAAAADPFATGPLAGFVAAPAGGQGGLGGDLLGGFGLSPSASTSQPAAYQHPFSQAQQAVPAYQQQAQQRQQPGVGGFLAPQPTTGYTSTLPPHQLSHGPAMRPSGRQPSLGDTPPPSGGQASFSFVSDHINSLKRQPTK